MSSPAVRAGATPAAGEPGVPEVGSAEGESREEMSNGGFASVKPTSRTSEGRRHLLSLGVCCMASKASSQPMQAILRRLERCGDFLIVVFPEETILTKPIEEWPVVQCLVAFASSGFPLEKCIEYCKLVRPRCINNIEAQVAFRSRAAVYKTLTEWCIPCPDHVIVDHATVAPGGENELVENENFIVYNGKKICKPFVEKPEDGDRHDIWIYYPHSIGGGVKKLFRKVKDKSSEFDPNQNKIRRDGVYVYEPFLPTQGTDIKVYTVGAGYVHAEARKAPTVDGKVQRSKDGKEVRYPVVLTQGEKAIAAFIVKAFRQNICGFDILRTDGGSIVCDVNGWSFVKGNQKYYNDCSTLIRKHLLDECGVTGANTSTMMILGPGDEDIRDTGTEISGYDYSMRESLVHKSPERLRSVIVVMRHGDRRPKEKMKFKTKQPEILSYFDDSEEAEVKLKTPEEMQTLKDRLASVRKDLRGQLASKEDAAPAASQPEAGRADDERVLALREELQNIELLIPVLEMKDRFSGLERKVQLKAVKWKQQKDQPKKVAMVLVVAKWGGELTVGGLSQSQELGRRLRHDLYPNDPTGLLRLHSSFRHDFKIYSSQEGRCQITAAAFTKGFLDLEGDIIPILVSLVTRDSFAQGLLDEPIPKKQRTIVKMKIENLLLDYADMSSPESLPDSCPTDHSGLREAVRRIGSPLQLLHTIRCLALEYVDSITAQKEKTYEEMRGHSREAGLCSEAGGGPPDEEHDDEAHDDAVPLGNQVPLGPGPMIPFDLKDSCKRKWLHLRRKEHRWKKLLYGFVKLIDEDKGYRDDGNVTYDTSKIPDVWDNLYYDMLTHRHYLGEQSCRIAEMMVGLIHPLNEWVCLSEYGISQEEKLRIGVEVTWRLLGKMLGDLEFMIEDDSGSLDEAGQRRTDKSGVRRTVSGVRGSVYADLKMPVQAPRPESVHAQASRPASSCGHDLPADPLDPMSPGIGRPATSSGSGGNGLGGCGEGSAGGGDGTSPSDSTSRPPGLNSWREWATNRDGDGGSDVASSVPATPRGEGQISPPVEVENGSEKADACKKRSKLSKLTPAVRNELKQALRDSSDWHPRLNDEVAKLTDIKNTRIVRSRIYVTSASTMHSLLNVLRHGQCASGDEPIVTDLDKATDLNYLTHLVLRCYEQDSESSQSQGRSCSSTSSSKGSGDQPEDVKQRQKARYRVEVSMSPGVQVFKDGEHVPWPKGPDVNETSCLVAPLQIVADSLELSRLERFLTEAIKEYGVGSTSTDEEEDKQSDLN
uniref:Inositol hexakisphosphate and diphosphoinositol-pentakisphosphate kinase n=1 Tax=Alexandrium monilatum TaxID=311494 RepID=A0A7S4SUP1_9DINO